MVKTTKHHFALFKETVSHYVEKLNLGGWDILFLHREIEDKNHPFAIMDAHIQNRGVNFVLNKNWDDTTMSLTDKEIRKCGRHEAIHLLIAELQVYALQRFSTKDQIMQAVETITVTLTDVIK